jgi:hypothetical protein
MMPVCRRKMDGGGRIVPWKFWVLDPSLSEAYRVLTSNQKC